MDQEEDNDESINTNENAFSERNSAKNPESSKDSHSKDIIIYVYQPYIRIKRIKLDVDCHISILSRVFPQDSIYIFNGQILEINKTFSDYQIINDSTVVLITPLMLADDSELVLKWSKKSKDFDALEERINFLICSSSREELARIKDIRIFNREMKRKNYSKFLESRDSSQRYINEFQKEIKLKIKYQPAKEPSEDPFPIKW